MHIGVCTGNIDFFLIFSLLFLPSYNKVLIFFVHSFFLFSPSFSFPESFLCHWPHLMAVGVVCHRPFSRHWVYQTLHSDKGRAFTQWAGTISKRGFFISIYHPEFTQFFLKPGFHGKKKSEFQETSWEKKIQLWTQLLPKISPFYHFPYTTHRPLIWIPKPRSI